MKNSLAVILVLFCTSLIYSQKLNIKEGNFDFIKTEKKINVEFVYDNQKIFKDNLSNDEYVESRYKDLEEKGKGKGAAWKKTWFASRDLIYEPKFLELMNRDLYEEKGITFEKDAADAKYTLILETVWLYPGWNAAVMRQPAKVSTLIKFVETNNRDNVLVEITSENAPGNRFGGTFSNEDRLGEGYAKTGKTLSKLIMKEVFNN